VYQRDMKVGEFFHKLLGGIDYKEIDGVLYVKAVERRFETFRAHQN